MKDKDYTVEDYIETLAGLRTDQPFKLETQDYNFVASIARQVFKGTGLTDRQYEAMKEKLLSYEQQFINNDYVHLASNLDSLRIPVRTIDRSRWIKIVDYPENMIVETNNGPWIAVRFSFQKSLISATEKIRQELKCKPTYDNIKKIQYYEYSEKNLHCIVSALKDRNFEIDDQVLELYNTIDLFVKEDHLPGVFNYQIKNVPQSAMQMLTQEIGSPSPDNILLYKDRSFKYGLNVVENITPDNSLESKIAHRKHPSVQLDDSMYPIDSLILSLENLKRMQLLVLTSTDACYDTIVTIQKYIKNLIDPSEVSVMFRLDNQGEGIDFNNYIKREKINNLVDKNTKVVYNLDNKVPKPLFNSEWSPSTILVVSNTGLSNTRKVLDHFPGADLILYYSDSNSPGYARYMRREMDVI